MPDGAVPDPFSFVQPDLRSVTALAAAALCHAAPVEAPCRKVRR